MENKVYCMKHNIILNIFKLAGDWMSCNRIISSFNVNNIFLNILNYISVSTFPSLSRVTRGGQPKEDISTLQSGSGTDSTFLQLHSMMTPRPMPKNDKYTGLPTITAERTEETGIFKTNFHLLINLWTCSFHLLVQCLFWQCYKRSCRVVIVVYSISSLISYPYVFKHE